MTEIKVERKRRAPIWPWIVGIIILLGLIWFLVGSYELPGEAGDSDPIEKEEKEVEEEGIGFNNATEADFFVANLPVASLFLTHFDASNE